MGMEFCDSTYLLSGKNSRVLRSNMVVNLALGFTDLDEGGSQKWVKSKCKTAKLIVHNRYYVLLIDTVKIDHEKGICLTEGMKQSKDVLFFINSQSDEEDEKAKSKSKKPPAEPLNGTGSPAKNKVAGGNILWNKTRSSAQEDVILTTAARIAEHQRDWHATRQRDGLAKYSEEGTGAGNKEGKTWKQFQSYKGKAGLPKEIETMRVSQNVGPEVANLTRLE